MPKNRELVKGSIDSLLLSMVEEKPMYGYQVIKELEKRSQGYFRFKEGTLYPALHRLETAGLVSGRWELLPNGRQRRYYYITDKGRRVLAARMSEWREFFTAMNLVIQPSGA